MVPGKGSWPRAPEFLREKTLCLKARWGRAPGWGLWCRSGCCNSGSCKRRHCRPCKCSRGGWTDAYFIASCCRNRSGVRDHTHSKRSGSNRTRETVRTATGNVSFPLPGSCNQSRSSWLTLESLSVALIPLTGSCRTPASLQHSYDMQFALGPCIDPGHATSLQQTCPLMTSSGCVQGHISQRWGPLSLPLAPCTYQQ